MQSASILAGISLFLFILKQLMILSKTNLGWNPFWIALSFLNSCLLYPWFLWAGYMIALQLEGKKLESQIDLKRTHDLEIQHEKSRRYEIERKLESHLRMTDETSSKYQCEIQTLQAQLEKKNRSATEANEEALRSFL